MMKKILIQSCLIILIISGCAGLGDYNIDLPGNYSILRTSKDQVTIAPKTEIGWGANVIPEKVIAVGWNQNYIIAKQKKVDDDNFYYWILDINNGTVDGPLNNNNFQEKKIEYEISKDINLKDVEDLK